MTSTNDLRTRLLARSSVGTNPPLINPDGPEAVAALDERDERIKALETGLREIAEPIEVECNIAMEVERRREIARNLLGANK